MKKISLIHLNIKILLFTALILSNINSVLAIEPTIKPFIKGSFEKIQKENNGKPYIIAFWSETCGYCMKELALLGKLSKKHPSIEIVTVSTDPFLEETTVNRILSLKNLSHVQKWVFADNYAARLYPDVDKKWRGELPLTYFFDRNNKMLKHMGTINKQELTTWFTEQSTTIKQPLL
ncbi:MAG: TlpA family protein disulfide reductase [Methylococcales bacterium]|nr:TlpA family protein disulfide reductase [Methylococcales bacterium]